MTTEDEIIGRPGKAAGDLYCLQQRVDPSSKSTDALQDQMMRLRAAGKVKFDIKSGQMVPERDGHGFGVRMSHSTSIWRGCAMSR